MAKNPIFNIPEEHNVWNKVQTEGYGALTEDERDIFEYIRYEQKGKSMKDDAGNIIRYFPPLKVSPKLERQGTFKEVRIVPKGSCYICEIVYEEPIRDIGLNKNNILGIDIGKRNLLSTVNNIGLHPILIRGGPIVSVNQFFNKQIAKFQQQSNTTSDPIKKESLRLHIDRISMKRYNRIQDYFHKASNEIVKHCRTQNIGKIIIGYNEQWKEGKNLSKKFRKEFYPLPFDRLLDMIKYKAELIGIEFIETEESYTSQTCGFCGVKDKISRKNRGLYLCRHCADPKAINADVNGAINIVKKIEPGAFNKVPKSNLLLSPKVVVLPSWSKSYKVVS